MQRYHGAMLGVSTAWNAERCGGWEPAVAEWIELGHARVLLDGPTLFADAEAAGRRARGAKGAVLGLVVPPAAWTERATGRTDGLAATSSTSRREAVVRVARGLDLALAAGCGTVVLPCESAEALPGSAADEWQAELRRDGPTANVRRVLTELLGADDDGRGRRLEALCRSLHELSALRPELTLALSTPREPLRGWNPAELQLVFEELPGRRLAYWHHAGRAARLDDVGAVDAEAWVDAAGDRLVGVTLEDWSRSGAGLPVGAGVVDWRALSRQLPVSVPRVVSVDGSLPAPLVLDALREAEGI